jgi:hypothetical protein
METEPAEAAITPREDTPRLETITEPAALILAQRASSVV